MRVALVTDYYVPTLGGVQTVVKAHKETLQQSGHEATVFAPLQHPSSDPSVIRLPTAVRFAPDGYPFAWSQQRNYEVLKRTILERGIELVHVHTEMYGALAAIQVARELGLPIVQTMHARVDVYTRSVMPVPFVFTVLLASLHRRGLGGHQQLASGVTPYTRTRSAQRMWRLMVSQANVADQVIVPSAHFAKKLLAQGVTTPVTVLSNGIEESLLDRIGSPVPRERADGERLRAMWCGRVSPEKRPEVFVDAVQLVEGATGDLFGDGVARGELAKRASQLPAGTLRVHGAVSQSRVLEGMKDAHVFVSTSWDFDNQPMVILEAVASGLPVIVSDPDLAECLPPGSFIITPTPDVAGLANVLSTLTGDPRVIRRMSEAAIAGRHVAAQDAHRDALLGVYASALSQRVRGR